MHRRLADTYRRGRVLLAGDGAHVHAPFGGQGMLTGTGDAENLAWKLALVVTGRANESLVDTYETERRPLAAQVLRGTTAVTKLNIAASPVGRALRDRVLMPLFKIGSVQRWATYSASQLWVSYRRGPLGTPRRTAWLARNPRLGDRIADLPCLREDGTPSRLHAELRGRFAVLAPETGADGCVAAARQRLGRHVVALRATDGPTGARHGEVWLVRPDAHLAWRGRHDSAGLETVAG